ncbi:MAG: hypothetical protein ACREA8_05105 [Nitrosotalea sp.]
MQDHQNITIKNVSSHIEEQSLLRRLTGVFKCQWFSQSSLQEYQTVYVIVSGKDSEFCYFCYDCYFKKYSNQDFVKSLAIDAQNYVIIHDNLEPPSVLEFF